MAKLFQLLLAFGATILVATASSVDPLMIKLNNGVMMPQMSLGTWQYNDTESMDCIAKGWKAGFRHIDTAQDYNNQGGVGKAIAKLVSSGVNRSAIFLTTKTPPCTSMSYSACYKQAYSQFEADLKELNVEYVDLILLHGASHRGAGKCDAQTCAADAGQWKAYEDLYKMGKARSIGVSNYCQSCFECLLNNVTVVPAVNQIQFHVGMGDDPSKLVSYTASKGIVVQAYSPLGNGKLVTDASLAAIGKKHGKSGAQVALKWLVDKGVGVVTKADNPTYLAQDVDMYNWNLTSTETAQLSANNKYPSNPSWACTE